MEEEIRNIFLETLGEPVNIKDLNEYIKFCLTMKIDFETLEYTEVHHILPRSKFKSFYNEERFQVKLLYEDHVKSHLLLAKAFPIKNFIYPLLFMARTLEEKLELNELKSLSTKDWWKEIKEDNSEIYMNWVEKRSNWMKENQKPGCNFYQKVLDGVKLFWEEHPEERERVSKRSKNYWKNLTEEEYLNHCNNMKWKDSSDYESRCEKNRKRYDDEDYRLKHKERMTEVNQSEEKRLSAGKKIKELWTTPEFREKTNNSRILGKQKREEEGIILTTSATMKEKWKDPEYREYNLSQRKKKREEKKLNEAH